MCGGRDFKNQWFVWAKLDEFINGHNHVIIQGGARGCDKFAKLWAISRGIPYETYEAQWSRRGRAAGAIRNQKMIDDGKPDLVIAFRGNTGTADMVRRAEKAGIRIHLVT